MLHGCRQFVPYGVRLSSYNEWNSCIYLKIYRLLLKDGGREEWSQVLMAHMVRATTCAIMPATIRNNTEM